MKQHIRKATAAALTATMALGCLPLQTAVHAADETATPIYQTDFEDGDISAFSKRGDDDTSVISISNEDAHSGTACMYITERSQGWNGPQISLADCEAGVKYQATCWVKTAWYNECKLSLQYTDAAGDPHYNNLCSVVSQGDWVQIPLTKFSFSPDVTDVYLYIECSDGVDLYVDDFSLSAAPVYNIQTDIAGLKDVYADYFRIGGAVTADELAPKATQDLILKHYNSITLGNELKPENMLNQAACQAAYAETGDNTGVSVTLNGAARTILNFAQENNISVRGHVLVWHSQTPGWFFKEDYTLAGDWVDKDTMLKRMENYIKGVFEVLAAEYPDVDFYAWDVVNEAWLDDGKPRNPGTYDENYNNSGWTAVFGDNSFIESAFAYARKYAPAGCKLYYNDYNEYMPQKTEAIIEMATALQEKDLIDGIGLQSHLDVNFPGISAYETAVKKFAATGLDLQVTELDATTEDVSEAGYEKQAQYYSDIMDVLVNYADSISAVVFWGTTDDMSWRAEKCPLLFNEDYTAKPAYYSIIDGITPSGTTTTTTTATTSAGDTLRGDMDCDGAVGLSDAILLARYVAEDTTVTVSSQGLANADMDASGTWDAADVTAILRILAKLEG